MEQACVLDEKLEEIKEKIKNIDKLPTYEEARQLLFFLEEKFNKSIIKNFIEETWFGFCKENWIYNIYNIEFIDALTEEIKKLGGGTIIEICAGNGKLTYWLRKRGIDILATDDYSWKEIRGNESLVKKLSHKEALEKYKPKIVIASWIPYESRIGFYVLDFPSVKYFIDIGEDVGGASWLTDEIYKREDFKRIYLDEVNKYSICRSDFYPLNSVHSRASLFRKIK